MSGDAHHSRRPRPPKMYMVASDYRVQDQLEGTIRLQRGQLCVEQEGGGHRGGRGQYLWVKVIDSGCVVKVIDSGCVVKVEREVLSEVSPDLAGLLEPVPELELRVKLLSRPQTLHRFLSLALGSELRVPWSRSQSELAEAQLRYRGPLTRGSSAVYFGVQLKGWAAGRGTSNGFYKGRQLFVCPDACGLFLPVSEISLPRSSRSSSDPLSVQSRSAECVSPLAVGQRVCFPQDECVQRGTVQFCGPLSSRASSALYVGVLLEHAVGSWDGYYKNTKLCSIPSPEFGALLPLSKVTPEARSERPPLAVIDPKPLPKLPLSPLGNKPAVQMTTPTSPVSTPTSPMATPTSQTATPTDRPLIQAAMLVTAKKALQPPSSSVPKAALKPPPLSPPIRPQAPPTRPQAPPTDHTRSSNGFHNLPSPPVAEQRAELGTWLEVGSMVEVNDPPLFGVIRWIGQISGLSEPVAGIELDQELSAATDGSYLSERHFRCPANKGLFVKLRNCRRDSRFPEPELPINQVDRCNSIAFANWSSERVEDNTPPVSGLDARMTYEGFKKGIQGHLNSCYLDATLFSMFSCCSSFDWLLFWPTGSAHNKSAQDLLRCEIVNPLRRFGYVCASKTMALRKLLKAETADSGFTNEEKDPEEFLNQLFLLLRVEPLLKISSASQQPQECFLYQLFPPSVSASPASPLLSPLSPLASPALLRVASVQALLESSFMHSGLKLTEAPSCLPLLMPRFGKEFKMFDAILPSLTLDITDLLEEALRQCSICQLVAQWECLQCYEDVDITPGQLKQYCSTCNTQVHTHKKRQTHRPAQIRVPQGSWEEGPVHGTRQLMDLCAVTCIETSHYVSFVKHGPEPTDWLFFDSMADREGGENGFNVPQVRACPEVGRYLSLSSEEFARLDSSSLRDPVRRLLCDAYMCLYHCPQLSLYK
ncbi:ubiquitin carboxyl-terminal hydrolase CYLD isoform X1 [Siphateles boraxobius]|uniref:ubiquitin carboxyl-terminal hydrolase CYLD isoform X1 n=1 Tax=Siphateles boraxobius TaxID=180520 RepID=UPI004063AA60